MRLKYQELMNLSINIIPQSKQSKMKSVNVKLYTYIDFFVENNDKDPKFKVGDHVRMSKYKETFSNGYVPNWSEQFSVINKFKNTVPWTYVISGHNGEEIVETFYDKELENTNQTDFRVQKVIKRKGDKLYVKWKGCDNLVKNWIDKKEIVIYIKRVFS